MMKPGPTGSLTSTLAAVSETVGAWAVHHIPEVGSTNDVARDLLRAGATPGFVVRADIQTGGRGRRGRAWASPAGNLYMSAAIAPDRPTPEWPLLSLMAAASLAESLITVTNGDLGGRIGIKWPNDVLVGGRKISGILLETEMVSGRMAAVVGIGVNIASHPDGTRLGATHLDEVASGHSGIDGVFAGILEALDGQLTAWEQDGAEHALATWRRHGLWIGERISVETGQGDIAGRFEGVTDAGLLRLRGDDGRETVHAAGDVSLSGPIGAGSVRAGG